MARASREAANGGEARAKGRAVGPPLLQINLAGTDLAADGPRPQTPGGGLFLALAADVLAAFPAGVWRQRSETFIGHRASGAQRLLTPVALWLSKQVAAYVRLSYIRVSLYV